MAFRVDGGARLTIELECDGNIILVDANLQNVGELTNGREDSNVLLEVIPQEIDLVLNGIVGDRLIAGISHQIRFVLHV